MTLADAAKKGITKLKRPTWLDGSIVTIDIFESGTFGPWLTLHARQGETHKVLWYIWGEDGWEDATDTPKPS